MKAFDLLSQSFCDRVENILEEGSSMFQGGHYDGIGIRERRRSLEEIYKKFCRKLDERRHQLNSSLEFYQLVEQVNANPSNPSPPKQILKAEKAPQLPTPSCGVFSVISMSSFLFRGVGW